MRFGFCAGPEHLETLQAAGYDYTEWAVAPALAPEKPEDEIMSPLIAAVARCKLTPETFNVFLPGDLRVVGDVIDKPRQERYLQSAFDRVSRLGGSLVVFGSGRSRHLAEGFSRDIATEQVIDFLRRAVPIAETHAVKIAIEPLSVRECNFINSVAEAVEIAKAVASPAVGVLSDLYHVTDQNQPYSETEEAGALLTHVHVAGAEGRRIPNREDISFLADYFAVLKAAGYSGRISIEGHVADLTAEAPVALETLRAAWDHA